MLTCWEEGEQLNILCNNLDEDNNNNNENDDENDDDNDENVGDDGNGDNGWRMSTVTRSVTITTDTRCHANSTRPIA